VLGADDESVRFVRGLQDVLLTIGIVALLGGASVLGGVWLGPGGQIISAAIAFVLAIPFARRWRLVLPSMALAAGFVVACAFAAAHVVGSALAEGYVHVFGKIVFFTPFLAGSLSALVASALFYAVFRLPFALGMIAVSALAFVLAALHSGPPIDNLPSATAPAVLILGLLTLAAAMAFDASDPLRRTIRADNAFWLHLAAAPMIVHGAIWVLAPPPYAATSALIILGVVLVLAAVALTIDRRALFIAGLGYFVAALVVLVRRPDIDPEVNASAVAGSLAFTGAFALAVGVGWRRLRRLIVAALPANGLRKILPPVGN
jgi:hypothetical protein